MAKCEGALSLISHQLLKVEPAYDFLHKNNGIIYKKLTSEHRMQINKKSAVNLGGSRFYEFINKYK